MRRDVAPGQEEKEYDLPSVIFSEFLGSALFVFIGGCATSITGQLSSEGLSCLRVVAVALFDAFTFYALIYMIMKLSRGKSSYLNAALTTSLCAIDVFIDEKRTWRTHVKRTAIHVFAQLLGSMIGAVGILLAVPGALHGVERTGVAYPRLDETSISALGFETVLTFFFVLVVLAVRIYEERKSSIILVFTYFVVRLLSFPLTGGYCNPSRAFGHALVGNGWEHLWIFVAGPFLGALLATGVFILLHNHEFEAEK